MYVYVYAFVQDQRVYHSIDSCVCVKVVSGCGWAQALTESFERFYCSSIGCSPWANLRVQRIWVKDNADSQDLDRTHTSIQKSIGGYKSARRSVRRNTWCTSTQARVYKLSQRTYWYYIDLNHSRRNLKRKEEGCRGRNEEGRGSTRIPCVGEE